MRYPTNTQRNQPTMTEKHRPPEKRVSFNDKVVSKVFDVEPVDQSMAGHLYYQISDYQRFQHEEAAKRRSKRSSSSPSFKSTNSMPVSSSPTADKSRTTSRRSLRSKRETTTPCRAEVAKRNATRRAQLEQMINALVSEDF